VLTPELGKHLARPIVTEALARLRHDFGDANAAIRRRDLLNACLGHRKCRLASDRNCVLLGTTRSNGLGPRCVRDLAPCYALAAEQTRVTTQSFRREPR
jgi:hypothetical protein